MIDATSETMTLRKFLLVSLVAFGFLMVVDVAQASICKVVPSDGSLDYQVVGLTSGGIEISATPFTLGSNCTVAAVGYLLARDVGGSQDFLGRIYTDAGGLPGAILETGTAIHDIPTYPSYAWGTSTFSGTLTLSSGTTYWMAGVASSLSSIGHIVAWLTGGGGMTKGWNGSAWVDGNNPQKTAAFTIEGVQPDIKQACNAPSTPPTGYTLLAGGMGDDKITLTPFTMFVGNGGNDTVHAINGDVIVCLGDGNDTVTLGKGFAVVAAGEGKNKVLTGNGNKVLTSGSGDDEIVTGSGDDEINAGGGKNKVITRGGSDEITTLDGDDFIDGGAGADICTPGGGVNTVLNC